MGKTYVFKLTHLFYYTENNNISEIGISILVAI